MSLRPYHPDPGYYQDRAYGLLASALDATPDAVAAFDRHDAPLTDDGARTVLAREHGEPDWPALLASLARLADDDPFVRAFRAVETRDVAGLAALVDGAPELVTVRGTNGNDLLGLASATCDERLVRVLLERGADPARGNVHGWTALHQAGYSNLPLMARLLLDAGAPVSTVDASARGDGGTPLVVALFWGNAGVAEVLVGHGVHPANLRAAAGLGRLDLVRELAADPTAAGAHRGFYRPHSGFPRWRPSDDPPEVLDEALAWAARNGQVAAVELLVELGAAVDADVYRGTALAWAASRDRTEVARALLTLGADPSGRTTFGGPAHGEGATPLHLAAESNHVEVIGLLLDAGADPNVRDARHDSTPAGWAEYGGHPEAVNLLCS